MVDIPLHSIVVMVGTDGSGKTTWAHDHFPPNEIVGSQQLREQLLARGDNYQHQGMIWQELVRNVEMRLHWGSRVIVDHTNLNRWEQDTWANLSDTWGVPCVFVVVDQCHTQKLSHIMMRGTPVSVAEDLLVKQQAMLNVNKFSQRFNNQDGIRVINQPTHLKVAQVPRGLISDQLLVVGDVHGDYVGMKSAYDMAQRENRLLVWLGDVIDYGNQNLQCVKLAHKSVMANEAVMIWGNHERKISKWIRANWGQHYQGRLSEANMKTIREIDSLSPPRKQRFLAAWRALENMSQQCWHAHKWLFTHGAAHEFMWHNHSHRLPHQAGERAYFGETCAHAPVKADGYPNRVWNWVTQVPMHHSVVVGHDWLDRQNHEIVIKRNPQGGTVYCIDTGNSKGGRLTALAINTVTDQVDVRYVNEVAQP